LREDIMAVVENAMYKDLEDYVNDGRLDDAITLLAAIIEQDTPQWVDVDGEELGDILEGELE
jgi:hypothetical protein